MIAYCCPKNPLTVILVKLIKLEVWNLKFDFKSVKFKHIPREKNREADKLVNEALDSRGANQQLI